MYNSNDDQPQRDRFGRFVPGHRPLHLDMFRKKPGEVPTPHETIPGRDKLGRLTAGDPRTLANSTLTSRFKRAFLECADPEQVRAVYAELFRMTQSEHNPDVKQRLEAIALFLDRTLGRPMREIHVENDIRQVNVKTDLSQLSDNELHQLEIIMSKTGTPDAGA